MSKGTIPYSLHFFETKIIIITQGIKLSNVKQRHKSKGILYGKSNTPFSKLNDKVTGKITNGNTVAKNITSKFFITLILFFITRGASVLPIPCQRVDRIISPESINHFL